MTSGFFGRLRALLDRRRDGVIAAVLAAITVFWMLSVEGRQGIGRDEAQYMRAGEHYWGWFAELGDNLRAGRPRASFTPAGLDRFWSDNAPDHPVIMKVLFGLSWRLFSPADAPAGARLHVIPPAHGRSGTLPIFARPSTAFRFPAILMAGLLAASVFFFARLFVGRLPAAAAAALTIAQPHYFFHAQIACFDAPITTMAVLVGFAYFKSLRSPRWAIATGVLFGLALGVKHNAWLMPIFLVGHYVWMRRADLRRFRPPAIPLVFVAMALLGPLIFLAHWPWLWSAPIERTRTYVLRHLEHEHYNFEYLDRNWNLPPRDTDLRLVRASFPLVSTATTLPVTTMLLAGIGAAALYRRRRRAADNTDADLALDHPDPSPPLTAEVATKPAASPTWRQPARGLDRAPGAFFFVQIAGPIAVLMVPSAPIFGGVKHFMPAFPFIAVLAAIGISRLLRGVGERLGARLSPRLRTALPASLALLLCLPALCETRRSHPDGLSHYNLLAGGFAGGASLGMNRQFWGYSVLPMLDFLAANSPTRGNTYWHDVLPDAINMYIRDGRLPPGLGNTGVGEDAIRRSDLGLIVYEKHMRLYEGVFWEHYGTTTPAYVRTREGVPMVTAYKRPGAPFVDTRPTAAPGAAP